MKINIILLILGVSIFSCKSIKNTYAHKNSIRIVQDGRKIKVTNNKIIYIEKKEFTIGYFAKKYKEDWYFGAQVAFFSNKTIFQKTTSQNMGCFKKNPYALGRQGPEGKMFFADRDEFLSYYSAGYRTDNGWDFRTVNLISKQENFAEFELPINKVEVHDNLVNMKETELKEFYIAIFIDNNFNHSIDDGELTKFTLKFKN